MSSWDPDKKIRKGLPLKKEKRKKNIEGAWGSKSEGHNMYIHTCVFIFEIKFKKERNILRG